MYDKLEQNTKEIEWYRKENKQYRIWINLSYDNSLEFKSRVVTMIDQLNVADKVTKVTIVLSDSNKWTDELITTMVTKYQNIYSVRVFDNNDLVDNNMHGWIQRLVK